MIPTFQSGMENVVFNSNKKREKVQTYKEKTIKRKGITENLKLEPLNLS